MLARILTLPLFVVLMGIMALAMFIPAFHATTLGDTHSARSFAFWGAMSLILTLLLALATSPYVPSRLSKSRLLTLVAAFAVLPLMLAVPFNEAVPDTSFSKSYFEMISSLTTTGATLYAPERLPASVHLWRGMVGWIGGYFMWIAAVAIFQPMNLGGFEVLQGAVSAQKGEYSQITRIADPAERIARFSVTLLPVYCGLTGLLWFLLILAGDPGLTAAVHAMSTISTSGISPIGGVEKAPSGRYGEALVLIFLVFALSRRTFAGRKFGGGARVTWDDPEFRLGLVLVMVVPMLLFSRHWLGAFEFHDENNIPGVLSALWGGFFSVASFLTTTGFTSQDWLGARTWSGLTTPGLILMGLALIGGGVATTAGGMKLLRVYALWQHGVRELEKLVEPHSIGGSGKLARHLRRQGAYIAWIFFMIFAVTVALTMLLLCLSGLPLSDAVIFAISALSTCGPVATVAGEVPLSYADLGEAARLILCGAMILGRVEALAMIALFNPEFWRR